MIKMDQLVTPEKAYDKVKVFGNNFSDIEIIPYEQVTNYGDSVINLISTYSISWVLSQKLCLK